MDININSNNGFDIDSLFKKHYNNLNKYIYSIVKDFHLAEDITQQTLLIAYKSLDKLKSIDKFKPWIYTIARNECLKTLNRNNASYLICENTSSIPKPTSTIGKLESYLMIFDIFQSIDHESKQILYCIYFLDKPLLEVSKILNMNYNTLKTKHKRLRNQLRTRFGKYA